MLSLGPMSAGKESYYLELSQEDYYTKGREPDGEWHGTGASALGLGGKVEPEQLRKLFSGFSPETGLPMTQRQDQPGKAIHRAGWDLTFSPPKSVSAYWGQALPQVRKAIEDAHSQAVKNSLNYIESVAGQTRRGKGGKRIESAKLVFALFEHGVSRRLDPCLHTHCLLLNVAVRADGTTGAVSSMSVLKVRKTADAIYHQSLRSTLESQLGLETRTVLTWFELTEVPSTVCRHFSKRRVEIEAALAESGDDSPKAVARAAIKTRTPKENVPRQELFARWQSECESLGWRSKPIEVRQAAHTAKAPMPNPNLNELAESFGYFTKDALVKHLVQRASGDVEAKKLISHAEKILEREAVNLGSGRYSVSAVGRVAAVPTLTRSELHEAIAKSRQLGRSEMVVHPNPPWEPGPYPNGVKSTNVSEFLASVRVTESAITQVVQEVIAGKTPKELAHLYGPDLTEPIRNAMKALETYLKRNGPDLGGDIRKLFAQYGPDISEIYRALCRSEGNLRAKALTPRTTIFVEAPEQMSAKDLLALEAACDLAGSRIAYVAGEDRSKNLVALKLSHERAQDRSHEELTR